MNQTEIILKGGRFYRRNVTETDLGSQEALLANLVSSTPQVIKGVGSFNMKRVDVVSANTTISVVTEIETLPFDCWWGIQDSTTILPAFHNPGGNTHFKAKASWDIAKHTGGTGLMVVSFEANSRRVRYVYVYIYKNGNVYVPPYPNLYEDGRVCMGDAYGAIAGNEAGKDLMTQLSSAYESFYSSAQNGDLLRSGYDRLFARDEKGDWKKDRAPFDCMTMASPAFLVGYQR